MELILLAQTVALGILEGITEFIPVSSTAHLLIAGAAIGIPTGAFLDTISIAIQSGAILAAVWYFWETIWNHTGLIAKLAIAFIPSAIAGLLLYSVIARLFDRPLVIALALIVGGIGLIALRPNESSVELKDISYTQAFLIGVAQIASFIPGISRAGATLIGGTLMNLPRSLIVPFSFLLAIPTIIGASVVQLSHLGAALSAPQWKLIAVGGAVAFVAALASMRFFIRVLTTKPLAWFGWYRIALGAVIIIFLA